MGAGAGGSLLGELPCARLRDILAEAVPPGALVACGGGELQRKPMAALRALVELGVGDLRVATMLGSADVEVLLGAGARGRGALGRASRSRASRRAGGRHARPARRPSSSGRRERSRPRSRLPPSASTRSRGRPGSEPTCPAINPWLKEATDPHTGRAVLAVRALVPDVALIHVNGIDAEGNAYVDGDLVVDELLARASRRVVVTYERLVESDPGRAAISHLWIDDAVEAAGGALPTGCTPDYEPDSEGLAAL